MNTIDIFHITKGPVAIIEFEPFDQWCDDVDRNAIIEENVTIWASDNGLSVDDLYWKEIQLAQKVKLPNGRNLVVKKLV